MYYQVEFPYLPFGATPQLPSCHLFAEATTVRPATTREAQDVDVYWRTDAKARGNLCDVCSCSARPDGVWLLPDVLGLHEPIVAGAAVASARRRAAAGAAAHLVGAARAQVVPLDEPDARRRRAADLYSPARRVRSLPHQFTRENAYHAHCDAVSEMCQSPAKGAPGSSPS